MDKTVSIEIPAPPDGHEAFFNDTRDFSPCVFVLSYGRWTYAGHGNSTKAILARKKRTLADWANEQPLFQAFAKIRAIPRHDTTVTFLPSEQVWSFGGSYYNLGVPPAGLFGKLKLTDGKWELA